MQELRATIRVATSLLGAIQVEEQTETTCCVITNFSSGGARLRVPEHKLLPTTFRLSVPGHQTTYGAELRWRSGEDVGVQFLQRRHRVADLTGTQKESVFKRIPRHFMACAFVFVALALTRTFLNHTLPALGLEISATVHTATMWLVVAAGGVIIFRATYKPE